ncbi:hypothetical protein BAY61_09345 [Prauserella marina]|uniref:Uncharacterized protein n=1 Tax=Prauserella marina TaxID=530584 RepID=A0A222VN14_9PSEU|nr:hypothetical protein [Prauserella marina]ASR35153.1 hypothetical protein BAY61_09345 [Prauserella marina]PWV85085.1 hypothetical protein DES30_1011106 [Prauserella marina]SDC05129.1 hypothetical protein SAMN05421630_101232 [Prauserella marina]
MDTTSTTVRLCAEGMRAEAEADPARAKELFEQAWADARDDYESCVAAHYLARHQPTTKDTLDWNERCLALAERLTAGGDAAAGAVAGFYPSLHANLARDHRDLGNTEEALAHYRKAAARMEILPEGAYRDWLTFSVAEGLRCLGAPEATRNERVGELVEAWCDRRELRALCLVLPSYYGVLGAGDDRERLATAVRMLHAERRLPRHEQAILGDVLATLTAT